MLVRFDALHGKASHMRRTLLLLTSLALAIGTLGACGQSDDPTAEELEKDISEELQDVDSTLTKAEADCYAGVVVDEVGVDAVNDIDFSADAPDEDDAEALGGRGDQGTGDVRARATKPADKRTAHTTNAPRRDEAPMTDITPSWQEDPTGRHDHRYWDGTQWTEHVADAGVAGVDPYEEAPAAAPEPAGEPEAVDAPVTFDQPAGLAEPEVPAQEPPPTEPESPTVGPPPGGEPRPDR